MPPLPYSLGFGSLFLRKEMPKKIIFGFWPVLAAALLTFILFWDFFVKGLVPIPGDIIVGIYYPWRDYVWNNFLAGVPFKNGLLSDIVSIIYPWRVYGMELLKQGIWPLWIPYTLGGSPLLANFQSGLFYPLSLFFFLFSSVNAWSIYIIFQPILASIFCYLFLKNLKLSNFASLAGAFIFSLSGFMSVWLEYGIVGHAGLWFPLILLVIDKLLKKTAIGWFLVGSLAVGFSALAGYPQITFFVLGTAFLYFLFKIFFIKIKERRNAALTIVSCFTLGILLAAIQLLPGFELWRLSLRQQDPTAAAFDFGLNPFKNLILFFAPDFYGNPATGNFWGWGAYNESASYVGIVGLLLALFAFFAPRKEKTLNFFKGLLLISLLMAFANPLSNFIYGLRLPIFASASAGRFFFLVCFSLAVLAAFGAESLVTAQKRRPFVLSSIIFSFPFLVILAIVFLKPAIWPDRNLLANLVVAQRNLILPSFLLLGSLVLFFAFALLRKPLWQKSLMGLILVLVIFDLLRFGLKYNSFSEKDYLYPQTALTDFLKEQKGLYRFYGLIPQSMFIPYALSSPEGYEPLMIKRYSEFANQINEEKFSRIFSGSRWVIVHRHESPLLNLLGVKYLLSWNVEPKSEWDPQYFKYPQRKYELVFQYGKSQVYENKEVLPRAFIIHDFQILPDEEILKTLMDKSFDPQKTLLLEEKPENLPQEKAGEDRVLIEESSYSANKVMIKTNLASDGFLFLSDNFYPGWQAFIDGKQTKIYRANYTFRAVFVPTGKHIVEFVYDPLSFRIGLFISLLTASGLFGFGVISLLGSKS